MEQNYRIAQLAQITGLTDRTIRNHLTSGILQGEKRDGIWSFTPEQIQAFVQHPAVRPSIQARKNSIVYDFMLDQKKKTEEACVILDLPGHVAAADAFCEMISTRPLHNIRFSFESFGCTPRVILCGNADEVFSLIRDYRSK